MPNVNVFSALSKYTSDESENYLTESLTFLINSLLQRERQIGIAVLTRLCVDITEQTYYRWCVIGVK